MTAATGSTTQTADESVGPFLGGGATGDNRIELAERRG
jgi:hypothetical protein